MHVRQSVGGVSHEAAKGCGRKRPNQLHTFKIARERAGVVWRGRRGGEKRGNERKGLTRAVCRPVSALEG